MRQLNAVVILCGFLAGLAGPGWCELQGHRVWTPEEATLRGMAPVNGGLLLFATGSSGAEIWFSDLTPGGAVLVGQDSLALYPWFTEAPQTVMLGGTVFFTVHDLYETSSRLWRSDGTAEGTALVASYGYPLGELNGLLIYSTGTEIWRSDGTESGTFRIGSGVSVGKEPVIVNGVMYFPGDSAEYGQELWRTDGTEAGTYMVKDCYSGTGDGVLESVFAMGNAVYFVGGVFDEGWGLVRSDGTEPGTTLVKPFPSDTAGMDDPVAVGNKALFFLCDYTETYYLWVTDGTAAGTMAIKTFEPNPESSSPTKMAVIDTEAFFIATDGTQGYQLWKSDGTVDGTTVVVGNLAADYWSMRGTAGGNIYFIGDQFYRSDGTAEGTVVVHTAGSVPRIFWSQDGITYCGSAYVEYMAAFWKLGRIANNAVEWLDLRDVEQGIVDEASYASPPCVIGNTTYYLGKLTGLWAVNDAFHFVKSPYSEWKLVGDRLELSVECAGGIGTLSYQWYKDGLPIDDATGATLVVESLTMDDGGTYVCRVTDMAETVYETEPATIEVFEEGQLPAGGCGALLMAAAGCVAVGMNALSRNFRSRNKGNRVRNS